MTFHAEPFVGVGSTLAASAIAIIPTDPATIDALAKWPAVVVLGAVACYSIYSMNKTADRAAKAQEGQAEALRKLAQELSQRPCIRHPQND